MKKTVLLLFTSLLLLQACKKKEDSSVSTNSFNKYVSVFPEKLISVYPTFEFFLKESVTVTTLPDNLVSISPEVPVEVTLNNKTLLVNPTEKLQPNTKYTITLHVDKLFTNAEDEFKEFSFVSKTKELLYTVTLESPRVYNKNYNYIEGFFNASDVFEVDKLPQVLKASYDGKIVPITFNTNIALASKVTFKIDSLQRYENDKSVLVTWNGAPIKSTSKGDRTIDIVGKNNFKVLDVNVSNGSSQELEISFSDPIAKNQDIKSLLQFSEDNSYSYKINSNVLTIYPRTSFRNSIGLEIFKELKNTDGFALKENFKRSVYFEEPKPSVTFINSGAILPNSQNLKINFNAINLKAVDATIYKIYKDNVLQFLQNNNITNQSNLKYVGRPVAKHTINLSDQGLQLDKMNAFAFDLSELISVENGAMYRVELSFLKEYSNYSCEESSEETTIIYGKKEVNTSGYDQASSSYYDDEYYEDYRWSDREDPCTSSYYYNSSVSTNILASDLGLIVKKGNNNTTFVAVSSITTTAPINGAEVKLYNLQQQVIASAKTNKDGIASFENIPPSFFASASNGNSTTYLRLYDGNSLSMSKFDVSGVKLQKGLKGYIYGERGVWRPGDQLFLTFILNDNANPIPEKHPVKFELINPQGKIVDRTIQYKNKQNMYAYAPFTSQDALTGNWRLKVSVGGTVFSKTIKVETIKPNRLKIKIKSSDAVVKATEPINANVEVKWLHGAIARGLKIDIDAKFKQTKTSFKGYNEYNFDDITRNFGTEEFRVLSGELNDEGKTKFSVNPSLNSKAPGMLQAAFITKVYENGGDFSTDVYTQKVSPYQTYVGLKNGVEKESKNYLYTNKNYDFKVVTVNEEGKPVATNGLNVSVYKISWRWWWNTDDHGLSQYDGSRYHETYDYKKVNTNANGKGSFTLKVDERDWGRYLVKVTDPKNNHTTSRVVYFDWPSWYGRKKNQNQSEANMLVFTTDKEKYTTKENVTVKFPSSVGARALITVENGSEVLNHFWVDTTDKLTAFSFPVLETYTPNVYVNITLLQPHSQTANDLPIRMYGSVPILVENPDTKLTPQIQLKDELEPESTATIRVTEKNGKPMSYTVALVDEGLLDLTRFKTPNAWSTFYARQSLGVKTWDIFDDVIGAYGGKINQILSIGGDEAEAGSKNKKANRFKPMVTFLGPFDLKMGETRNHQIKIPKYVGSVRAMVVASNTKKEAYGSDEKTAFVRKPVMVLASLPRKITPKETVTLPVTVFAMKPSVKNVKVTIEANEAFTLEGENTQRLTFEQPDEKMAYFQLKVNDFNGVGKVKIHAVSGSEKASYEVELDVLNPNPITTENLYLVLKGNESGSVNYTKFGTKGSNETTVELSSLPPMNFTKRLQYLIQYPHGCVEQTTSSVFPQLFMNDLFDLPEAKSSSIERNIKAGIQRLSSFQMSNGAMSYWQGGSWISKWGTTYAGHFMLEAKKKGYVLPIGFLDKWIQYQKQEARNWRYKSYNNDDDLSQAYRLYTLCLANNADIASMNRLRETSGISNEAKIRLASAYALIGKKSVATDILNTITNTTYQKSYYYGYGSETRNKSMSLETYVLLNNDVNAIKLAKEIADKLSSKDWLSTQTTSYGLLAMAKYALQNGTTNGINAFISVNGSKQKATTNKSMYTFTTNKVEDANTVTIDNKGAGVLYARVFNKGILPVGSEKEIQNNLEVKVNYYAKNGDYISPDELSQGTNFKIEVSIKNTTNSKIENVALTQFIPSGWEIINTRFTDFGNNTSSSEVDYTDIRDDRVSNYFTLREYQTKTFSVLVNASYLGTYYLPGVQAEAMYNHDYLVRTKGKWIKVVK